MKKLNDEIKFAVGIMNISKSLDNDGASEIIGDHLADLLAIKRDKLSSADGLDTRINYTPTADVSIHYKS